MLGCAVGTHRFPVANGLPILLPETAEADRTQQGFARQWELQSNGTYETDTIYGELRAQHNALVTAD